METRALPLVKINFIKLGEKLDLDTAKILIAEYEKTRKFTHNREWVELPLLTIGGRHRVIPIDCGADRPNTITLRLYIHRPD